MGRYFLNIHTKRIIYFAQIQSHLSYSLVVWGNMIPSSTLSKVQNKCIELINGKTATLENFQSLGILQLSDLIQLENCNFGFKLINDSLPERIKNLVVSDHTGKTLSKSHCYNTRHKDLLNKPKASSKAYRDCIIYKGTDTLQSLKAETREKPNLPSFITSCKKYFFFTYK